MRSTPAIDERLRLRLEAAVRQFADGSADKFARLVGYTNGGYVREVIGKKKPVREALIDRVHGARGMAGWFDEALTAASPSAASDGAAPAPPPRGYEDRRHATPSGWGVLQDLAAMPEKVRQERISSLHEEAENYRAFMRETLAKMKRAEDPKLVSDLEKAFGPLTADHPPAYGDLIDSPPPSKGHGEGE